MIQSVQNLVLEFCRLKRQKDPSSVIEKGLKEIDRLSSGTAVDVKTIAWLNYYVAVSYKYRGELTEAIVHFNRSLNFLGQFNDKLLWADASISLASISLDRGDYEHTISVVEVVIPFLRHVKKKRELAHSLQLLAVAQYELKRFEECIGTLHSCEHLVEKLEGLQSLKAQVFTTLGNAYYDLKRYEESEKYLDKALSFSIEHDDRLGVANAKCELSQLYRLTERWKLALEMALDARHGFEELGFVAYVPASMVYEGQVYADPSSPFLDHNRAEMLFRSALKKAEDCEYYDWIVICHTAISELSERTGKLESAVYHLKKRYEIREKVEKEATLRRVEHLEVTLEVEKERRKSEVELAKNKLLQEKNDQLEVLINEKKEFMALAAHDLKNPLSGIIGLVDFLKHHQEVREVEEIPAVLDLLAHGAESAMSIVRNLLEDHRLEEGQVQLELKVVDLNCICEHVRKSFERRANAKGIRLQCDCQAKGLLAEVDEFMMQQVLDNLISNAIKFCKQNDSVQVILKKIPEREIIELRVQDNGPGISEEDQKKLFQRFAKLGNRPTGNEGSSGLGLSIVKKLVELNQGEIRCESEFGSGSTFVVTLKAHS